MKKVLLLVLVLIFIGNVFSQTTPQKTPTVVQQKSFDLNEFGVRIEPDKRLIVVMAALDFAGVEISLTDRGKEFSNKLKADLKLNDEDLRFKMKTFFGGYKSRHPNDNNAELLAPFVSLAYALSPDLTAPPRTADLPGDLLEVLDFASFAREFYQKTNFEAKLPEYLQIYQAEGAKMRIPVSQMVADLLTYLNTRPQLVSYEKVKVEVPDPKNPKKKLPGIKTIEHERRFFIVPSLLATTDTVNFRNIGDDYYAIVPPNTNFSFSETRRAFLQFIIDPLVLKNAVEISPLRDKIKDLLNERRKSNPDVSPDVYLAVMRSLVSAVDTREIEYERIQSATETARRKIDNVAQTPEAKKEVVAQLAKDKQGFADETAMELSGAYERGSVLVFYFAEQLKGLENSGTNIDGTLKDMITSLDPSKEKNRLSEFADARQRGLAVREERRKNAATELAKNQQSFERIKQLKAKLAPIDELIKNKEFGEADSQLRKLLDEFPGESSIYYVLGRVASLSAASTSSSGAGTPDEGLRDRRLEDAKLFYSNAINSATEETDPVLLQLSYYALGRIHEFYEESGKALENYQKAASRGNLAGGAYNESMAAIARLSAPPKP